MSCNCGNKGVVHSSGKRIIKAVEKPTDPTVLKRVIRRSAD